MFIIQGINTSTRVLIFKKWKDKIKNFIRPLWILNREEKQEYSKNLLLSDDDSLKEYVKKLKKGKK